MREDVRRGRQRERRRSEAGLHGGATINGAPIQSLFDLVDQLGPSDSQAQIDVLDIVGDIAAVRVTMEGFHGADYVDLHVLKKTEDGWKIAAKVYTEK